MRDSALTIHGSLQAEKLGLALDRRGLGFTNIFSSDLQRAYKTAKAIRRAGAYKEKHLAIQQLSVLREQDFGFYEGKPFHSKPRPWDKPGKKVFRDRNCDEPGFQDVESQAAMGLRMDNFLDQHLLPLLRNTSDGDGLQIAIVSHGIILSRLWKCLLKRFGAQSVRLSTSSSVPNKNFTSLEHLGSWSNTGYLELEISSLRTKPQLDNPKAKSRCIASEDSDALATTHGSTDHSTPDNTSPTAMLEGWKMVVRSINNTDHLNGLKRTGGGVGSSKYDDGQKTIETFFKRRRE